MWRFLDWLWSDLCSTLSNEIAGGGSDPQPPTFIQPPPPQIIPSPTPAPDVGETSRQLFQSQLEFNPQLQQQAFDLFQQFAPQTAQTQTDIQLAQGPRLARSQFDTQAEIAPLQRALFEQIFPTQVAGQEELASQALQRLQSPVSLTPEQQAAQDAIRGRALDEADRRLRTSANVGGTLFGGRREQREDRARNELLQGFVNQDLDRQERQRQQTLQELIASSQVPFPQVQQPGAPQGFAPGLQSVTPSPDQLLQAILAAQSNFVVNPAVLQGGTPGNPGFFGSATRAFAA